MVSGRRQNKPPVIFNNDKRNSGRDHRPYGDQPCVFIQRNRLWIAHQVSRNSNSDYPCKSTVSDVRIWQEVAVLRFGVENFVSSALVPSKTTVRYRTLPFELRTAGATSR